MAARSQKHLSDRQIAAILTAIGSEKNPTAASVAKKARLKVCQVSCSGAWRSYLKSRGAVKRAVKRVVAEARRTTRRIMTLEAAVPAKPANVSIADVVTIRGVDEVMIQNNKFKLGDQKISAVLVQNVSLTQLGNVLIIQGAPTE